LSAQGPRQVLELAKVSRTFGRGATAVAALREVDLTVSAGEFVAVMGPSGSGKSSLLSLAGGLDRPTSGGVFVESTPWQSSDSTNSRGCAAAQWGMSSRTST
jgi:putative ABC transport system ATP-binding protein